MAFPNVSDIIATTIESRSKAIADNVTKNNALLSRLKQRGRIKTVSGGSKILQELSFAENGNALWYSGYDLLPVAAQDVISAAEFEFKQFAVPVVISGLEQLQNAGKEQMIDLMAERLAVAEATMANQISLALYSDVTNNGPKSLNGLEESVPVFASTGRTNTGTYGNINRANYAFWRPYFNKVGAAIASGNVGAALNTSWANLVRGNDRPDLILMDNIAWQAYVTSLQANQRFASTEQAGLGFPSLKFMDADVVLDGGIGGFAGDPDGNGVAAVGGTIYMLNTKYLHYRPHAQRNMVPLSPNKRYAINQDAEVQILGWAGNLTCSGQMFQGRIGQ